MVTPMLHSGPGVPAGASRRDREHARWRNLGYGRTYVQVPDGPPVQVGPMLRREDPQYRLAHIRCEGWGDKGCGDKVGMVLAVLTEWQGRPFTWAETWWTTDRRTKPALVTPYCMILDGETADGFIEAECSTHGAVSVKVEDVLDRLPAVLDRVTQTRRPSKVNARPARV
jgi:hypothetical protein